MQQERLINCIKNEIRFIHYDNKNSVHIAYGIDNNYARCMATSIASFCINNPNMQFTFHIMADGLTLNTKNKIEQLAKDYKINIYVYEINTNFLSTLPTQIHLPMATYFRFILPLILKNEKLLYYIDADIICLQNADELFDIKLGSNIIGAVPDLSWMNKKRNKALNLTEHTYFNAGMLVIDIKKWNEFKTFEKVIRAIQSEPKKFRYLDQDALNLILTKHIQYLETKFNCIDTDSINKNDIVLLHFAAHPKPWNIAFPISKICNSFNKSLYSYYEKQTPWKDSKLEMPRNYKEMKLYARALKHNKNYLKSIYWFGNYLINKL